MDDLELKKIIAEYLAKGISLAEIQKTLSREYGVVKTFLELRLIASELENVDWNKFNKDTESKAGNKTVENKKPEQDGKESPEEDEEEILEPDDVTSGPGKQTGKTAVQISPIARPGAVLSGSATFASGATAEWMIDMMGRVRLEKKNGEPTQEDIKDFGIEIQKALGSV